MKDFMKKLISHITGDYRTDAQRAYSAAILADCMDCYDPKGISPFDDDSHLVTRAATLCHGALFDINRDSDEDFFRRYRAGTVVDGIHFSSVTH